MAMSTLAKQTSRCAAVARPVAISRVRSVVVRAQKQEKPLSHLVTPALTAVVANALMALPAMADVSFVHQASPELYTGIFMTIDPMDI